ncbi:MAG: hypothetical protein U1F36_14665 [Planctomycetota bacterium]
MDLLFVGPRGRPGPVAAGAAELATLAQAAARDGHRVRLLQPIARYERLEVKPVSGLTVRAIPSRTPPFRAVLAHLSDLPLERALNEELRSDPPHVVHIHGFGGANSYLVPWLADRLGVAAVVYAEPIAAVLCHRGTLVDRDGAACREFDDATRCASCCRAHDATALGGVASVLAACLRPLRGLTPFPNRTAMLNRNDLIVHGLGAARRVCVRDASAVQDLVALGVPHRSILSGMSGDDLAAWSAVWAVARG